MTKAEWKELSAYQRVIDKLKELVEAYESALRDVETLERYGVPDKQQSEAMATLAMVKGRCLRGLRELSTICAN